jgi:hypothetical protein
MRFNAYDDIRNTTSIIPQSLTGSSAVNGVSVDTQGYDNAKLHVYAAQASGTPTAASVVVTLQESTDGTGSGAGAWANALDNTGTVIGFTLSALQTAAAVNAARVEGLNLNRKRFLRVVVTPSFTAGTSPAILAYGELLFGANAQQLPVTSAVSNT